MSTPHNDSSSEATPAKVLIADDHGLVREGTRLMLEDEPDIEVVAEVQNGLEAVEFCRQHCPDLVLMDVRMPEMDGLSATQALKEHCPQTSVLMVTSHENPDYLLEAIKAGAAGYLLKESSRHQLLTAVRGVLKGESVIDQKLSMQMLKQVVAGEANRQQTEQQPVPPQALSTRELEVTRLLAMGKTNRQITQELLLSLSTVKTYVQRIIAKLEVSDRTQAAVRAIELGLLAEQQEE